MPELPEVETIRRDLEKKIVGQRIVRIDVHDYRVIRNNSRRSFIKNLTGKTFNQVARRGKAIIFFFCESGYLIVQPMMTGQLIYAANSSSDQNSHTKITFQLSNHFYLNYNDQRLFGRLQYCRTLEEIKFLQELGVEPFSSRLNNEWLVDQLVRRATPIKNLLMNQKFIAGIGNIYASEILFKAGLHPQRPANTLKQEETVLLYRMIKEVLIEAVRLRGTSMRNYRDAEGQKGNYTNRIKVYGRNGQACLNCQMPVERLVQAGRSTFFCRRCQK